MCRGRSRCAAAAAEGDDEVSRHVEQIELLCRLVAVQFVQDAAMEQHLLDGVVVVLDDVRRATHLGECESHPRHNLQAVERVIDVIM